MGLPLHIFEPRYRELVVDCLAGSQEFGVTLIERGSEVGGGDIRSDAGTVAHIAEAEPARRRPLVPHRLRHPAHPGRARGSTTTPTRGPRWRTGPIPASPSPTSTLAERVVTALRRVLALRAELGDPAPPATIELGDDPVITTWQAGTLAGLGPLDLQQVLGIEGIDRRADARPRAPGRPRIAAAGTVADGRDLTP